MKNYSFAGIAPSAGAAGSFFFGPATMYFSVPPRAVMAGRYWVSMVRHFVGQASTQALQAIQRIWLISQLFSLGSTEIAWVGHLRWHNRQAIHFKGSIFT